MNNKGQTLVIFVIMLPIILIIFTLIIDLGLLHIEKRKIENIVEDSVEHYLTNIENFNVEEEIKTLINENINEVDKIVIEKKVDYVEITVLKTKKCLYSFVLEDTEIAVTFKGEFDSKKIIKG